MKKRLLSLALVSVMALSLAACGGGTKAVTSSGSESSEPEAAAEETAEETTSEAGGDNTISIMLINLRSEMETNSHVRAFYNAIDEWKEAHPDVEIIEDAMDQTSYQTKINAVGSSGEMPDIFCLKGSWTNTFVNNDWVSDISDDVDQAWRDIYVDNAFKFASVNDRIYGVPRQSQATGLVYWNKELWGEIGYDSFPATWDEVYEAVEKFKAKGITPFVMGNKPNWPAESCWLSTLADRYTGDDWAYSIVANDGSAKFTDAPFVEALTAFQNLAKMGAFNEDINSIDDQEQNTVYYNKGAATVVNGDWFIASLESSAPADVVENTNIALLPANPNGPDNQSTVSGGCIWFLAVGNNDMSPEKRALVIDLLKYATSQEVGNQTAEGGDAPAVKNPVYDATKTSRLFNDKVELLKSAEYVPTYDGCMDASVIETMNTGLQSLLIDEITPEQLAEDIQLEQDLVN